VTDTANDHPPATVDTAAYMDDPERRQRRLVTHDEKALLAAFLDYERDTVLWKLSGLTDEQLRMVRTPSGMSLLGLVKHLAYVERSWFQRGFLGQDVYVPWFSGDGDEDADFRIGHDETAASVLAFYRAEIDESNRIVAGTELHDLMARDVRPRRSLRWILIHLIEETARHAGHADLMRELADGQTGE
jgi:uncharacterized damage-inducible protein DinB